ncbi:MAG: response regulator transcription factor [Actinomadura rubrobrunea]|nr:response regulator transcription factor [Actinomadura rubrobrunea]
MSEDRRVLVVEDEANIRDLIETALRFHGFQTVAARTGAEALRAARASGVGRRPDLILLDVLLPDIDGFEVCRRLRAAGDDTPVIFLTARDTPSDTVTGLTLGGDDYVTKPFSIDALGAGGGGGRRRAPPAGPAGAPRPDDGGEVLRVADLELDEAHWTVRRAGVEIDLSPTEFRLLAYLMRNAGRVLTRAQLLENVWGWDRGGNPQVVETYISYLRRKLDPLGPPLIHTRRGVGYALRP